MSSRNTVLNDRADTSGNPDAALQYSIPPVARLPASDISLVGESGLSGSALSQRRHPALLGSEAVGTGYSCT